MKKIVVLGGGFAGLEAAIYLKKENFDVTLVSDRDFFYIYPTSIWIPTRESELVMYVLIYKTYKKHMDLI